MKNTDSGCSGHFHFSDVYVITFVHGWLIDHQQHVQN